MQTPPCGSGALGVTAPDELKYTDMEKHSRRKKKEDPKVKDTRKQDSVSPKTQDSVFHAKEGKKKPKAEDLIQSGADGDVFKAQTPNQETQGAPEVKEAPDVRVELPVDGRPAEIVKDTEETHRHMSDFESNREDNSRMSFKKKFPLRHNTKKKASLKNLSKNKKVVPFPEKEPNDILEEKNTPVRLDTPVEKDQREPPMGPQSQEPSPGQPDVKLDKQESAEQSSLGQPSQEQVPDKREPPEPASLGQPSQEQPTQGDDKEQQMP